MKSLMICNHQQYFSGDKIEKKGIGGACSAFGEMIDVYRVLIGKSLGKDTTWETQT
jgi:hypothetical protein